MNRHVVLALLLALGTSTACSEDPADGPVGVAGNGASAAGAPAGGSGTSSGGTGAGASGSSANAGSSASAGSGSQFECVNSGEINFDCPFNLPPINGSCAPAGECCHRASNTAKIAALGPDDPAVLEYRLNFVDVNNHPLTVGNPVLMSGASARADICSGEQCLLWRFTAPREGGAFVAGQGEAEIGIGAYNCDGTYSYYGPSAAPARPEVDSSDPGRWQSVKVPAQVDPAKEGIERYHIPFATNRNREIARSIFLWPADNTIDWELASSGFEITAFDTSDAGQDCMGARDGLSWNTVNGFTSYSTMEGNDTDVSNLISQTYCSLLAFGLLGEGMKETKCLDTPRCMPGTAGCLWVKLPDALCPKDEAERALFGCHLGAEGNPNNEEGYPATLECTPEAPSAALDPDMGATSDGQCCDPLGQSATLPPCNAYRTTGVFAAAAAEITDEPRNELPPVCQ